MSLPSSPPTTPDAAAGPHNCPSCGFELPPQADDIGTAAALLEAKRTILELQEQVRLLNQKNTAAADKLADYEDEVAKLRAAANTNMPSPPPSATFQHRSHSQQDRLLPPPSPSRTSFSRLSALLTRKSVPNLAPPPPQALKPLPSAHQTPTANSTRTGSPSTPNESSTIGESPSSRPPSQEVADALESAAEFAVALAREQSLRRRAEEKLDKQYLEIDDLSAELFQKANEMVATERMKNANLEERVSMLEQRDQDKKKRLERLEQAMSRIDRARAVLSQRNSA
ncbi:hypothetical protein MKZ38_001744 [Zalerion maritima]|uniref:GDP/GTP exchange factor Sec2 N-terminal domain-containing protein n=1 Tax=Zalerion maritima TaxID=339359 RepID=A0AAD5RXK8_9PEZI|nr:hypothetical protein MKZ38_001744 [Zalerion maritima]